MDERELEAVRLFFPATRSRAEAVPGDVVVGRYSVLPFYRELHDDLAHGGASLINSPAQHAYVADVSAWYQDLRGVTPETWFRWEDVPDDCGPLVVKGRTNSKKFSWKTHMYAADKRAASEVAWRLQDDSLISDQGLCFRRFERFRTYLTGLQDMPVTEEYRFFCCDGKVLCGAYYWSNYEDDLPERPDASRVPPEFLQEVLRRVGDRCRFVVVDVARLEDGGWTVVELNDGQMSGLSCNDPVALYSGLREVLVDK